MTINATKIELTLAELDMEKFLQPQETADG